MAEEPDPLTWVREVRHGISERFGHDPKRLVQHYMELQKQREDRVVSSAESTVIGDRPASSAAVPSVARTGSQVRTSEEIVRFVRSLIGWVMDRPHMYALTVGELDTLLHYLHLVWAEAKGLTSEWYDVCANVGEARGQSPAKGPVALGERMHSTEPADDPVLRSVLAHWRAVDDLLIEKGSMDRDYPRDYPR